MDIETSKLASKPHTPLHPATPMCSTDLGLVCDIHVPMPICTLCIVCLMNPAYVNGGYYRAT